MCTQVCRVSGTVWKKATEAVSEGVSDMQELITSLKNTERKVSPTSHAMVLLMPSQKQIKRILETDPTIDSPRMAGMIKLRSDLFKDFYLGGVRTFGSTRLV